MPIDTRGFPPSREGAKSKVLKEIIQYLDGRIGESLKNGGSVQVSVEPEGDDAPAEEALGDAPDEDDDEAKLLALARKRR